MKYTVLSTAQLLLLALLTGLIAAGVSIGFTLFREYTMTPIVVRANGECVKVVNVQNSHAFNCQDLNVLLRVYRLQDE